MAIICLISPTSSKSARTAVCCVKPKPLNQRSFCPHTNSLPPTMGAGASTLVEGGDQANSIRPKMLEIMSAESSLPADASDLSTLEESLAEVQKLRCFIKQCNEDFTLDSTNRCAGFRPSLTPSSLGLASNPRPPFTCSHSHTHLQG